MGRAPATSKKGKGVYIKAKKSSENFFKNFYDRDFISLLTWHNENVPQNGPLNNTSSWISA